MKEKSLDFRQIEWWVITFLFLSIILSNVLNINPNFNLSNDDWAVYFAKLFIPLSLFLGFYITHMLLLPKWSSHPKKWKLVLLFLLTFLGTLILVGIFSVNANLTEDLLMPFYFNTVAVYLGYLVLAYLLRQVFLPPNLKDYEFYNGVRLIAIYAFILIFLIQFQRIGGQGITVFYTAVIPILILIVFYNFYFIYRKRKQNKNTEANYFLALIIALIAIGFGITAIAIHSPAVLFVGIAAAVLTLVVIIPVSNLIFEKYDSVLGKISTLTLQVDQGSANLSFLRSQINPHFLFNALNTLYGTAMVENADRTGEGIQKLGDMMRFMLHENNQEKIAVEREKEYLENYVDLQLLRIKEQPQIDISFSRAEEGCKGEIAPMLLIPFVENAFKHGISFQKKSWVKISLRCLAGSVHLDVNNSIHRTLENDPEKKASGIGLENVRQRLQLLYPNKHELVIRENELEYFIHLSINL